MITFLKNIPLSSLSNYKIGGPADYFFEFKSKEELVEALTQWKKMSQAASIYVIGEGTNVLFSDGGFRGLVLKNGINFINKSEGFIECGAGTLVRDVVSFCIENSLSGLEWAGGLPGTIGGAVRGNAGAFGGETKDHVIEVESIDANTLEPRKRDNGECKFSYRMSIFKKGDGEGEIILSAKFKIWPGGKEEIRQKTSEREEYRKNRHPLDLPNIGSTFKNVPINEAPKDVLEQFKESIKNDPFPILPVAKLLSVAGLKGKNVGGAMVSPKHPNFIVNTGGAKATDVKELISIVKDEIKKDYGISLEEEIIYL